MSYSNRLSCAMPLLQRLGCIMVCNGMCHSLTHDRVLSSLLITDRSRAAPKALAGVGIRLDFSKREMCLTLT